MSAADAAPESARHWRLARRAATYGPSVWGETDALVNRYEDVIFFGSGAPSSDLYPLDRLREAAATAWGSVSDELSYGAPAGSGPLRALIARRMAAQGIPVDPELLMITNGSQQGIDYAARLVIDPGDAIVVEGPTYIGALQAFDAYEPEYLSVPVDAEGMDVAELARLLERVPRAPKLIYTIPTFQNPTGITMSGPRRDALLALARAHSILVLEDDPYGEMWYEAPPPAALKARDASVVYLGTFSKTIAPGIRVGWLAAPPELIGMLRIAKEAADMHGDRMIMSTVRHAAEGFLDGHVEGARAVYKARRDAMLDALAEFMPPGVTWSQPGGGFFVWVTLPEGRSAKALLPQAAARGVAFLPGGSFYPRGQEVEDSLRLNFSTLTEARIRQGIQRLGGAIMEFLGTPAVG